MRMVTQLKKFCHACLLLAFAFTLCGTAKADFPKVTGFPHTGAYQPQIVRAKNDVVVMSLAGNYNLMLADGSSNIEPRTEIAKAFLRAHADNYDFIVVFSNFEFDTKDATAVHVGVQNKVGGLGMPVYDNSAEFGSRGKLLGYIDMAALSRYNLNPYSAGFDRVLQTFAHEFLHQWGSQIKVRGADGKPSAMLLGRDGSHWSFLFDSGASVEYGNQWQDNGNGTFTSVASRQFFSPLDLYLMGMLKKEEVPPFFVIDSPGVDKTRLPENGVTISGTRRNLTIDDVIAAEGPRIPDAEHAQKEFRLGFVLLTRPGETVPDEQLAALNSVRTAIATRLAVLSGGRALVQSYLEPKAGAAVPDVPNDSGKPRANANPDAGLDWLRLKQNDDGAWRDNPFTGMRDTAVALDTMVDMDDPQSSAARKALTWMRGQAGSNTDYQARAIRALTRSKADASSAATQLLSAQNQDGGWGVAAGYQSNPLDTALALLALQPFEATLARGKLAPAAAYLAAQQNPDGGWGNLSGGVSRTSVSTFVMQALFGQAQSREMLGKAKVFLASKQNPDGGFGDSPSTVHDTANVMLALLSQNALDAIRSSDARAYIAASQQVNGSWDGSAYSTALAVRLLKSSGLFNWSVAGLRAAPAAPIDGQTVVLSINVSNTGNAPAPAGIARFYDGDPAAGGVPIGNDIAIPPLLMGSSVELQQVWNTLGKAGAHKLVLVVDPAGTVTEAGKSDNLAMISLTVGSAPPGSELSVQASDIVVTPAKPSRLPAVLGISARVSNIGKTDAHDVRVVLMEGQGAAARVVGEKQINLLARTQQVVNFSATISKSGAYDFTVVIDPDNRVAEQDKSDNNAGVHVETSAALDLEIEPQDIVIVRNPVYLGSDASFTIKLRNAGTQDSPPFKVRYTITDGTNALETVARTLQLASGVTANEDFNWRTTAAGNLSLKVEIDPDGVLSESDRSNNAAVLPFQVNAANGPNLALSFKELAVQPAQVLEGLPVMLSQTVRNTGVAAASNVEVAFYDGEPAGGRMIGTVQSIASLAPGEAATVGVQWARFPDAAEHLIFAVVDPFSKLSEMTRDDNSAFVIISPAGLPDLAVSSADLQMSPAAPRPGEAIDLAVKVGNLGKQAARDIAVRLYNGEPGQGGRVIGADQKIATLAGGDSQVLHFAVPASTGSAGLNFVVVIDPEQRIDEKSRDNNIARLDATVQDGDLFISERFFSPNGDGIKDSTTFSFRLKQLADVSVQVVNQAGKSVRQFDGATLTGIKSGSVTWDGKDERGALVADGDYRLRILAKDGRALGEMSTNLDTNRSSVLSAIDTEFEYRKNLSCEMPYFVLDLDSGRDMQFTGDEERVFMSAGRDPSRGMLRNYWHALSDGSELKPILPEDLAKEGDWVDFSVSANGKVFAAKRQLWSDFLRRQLWVMQADGSDARLLRDFGNQEFKGQLSDDGRYFEAVVGGKRLRIPVDGSAETILGEADAPLSSMQSEAWSPDGQWLARLTKVQAGDSNGDMRNVVHVEVLDRQGKAAFSGDTAQGKGDAGWQLGATEIAWSGDSRRFGFGHAYMPVDCVKAGPDSQWGPDFDPCLQQEVLMLVDLEKLSMAPVEASRMRAGGFEGGVHASAGYLFAPGEQKVVSKTSYCAGSDDNNSACGVEFDLESGARRPLFVKSDRTIASIMGFLPSGRRLLFTSSHDAKNSGSQCYQSGQDLFAVSSLLNLTADLRALRGQGGGIVLSGTAADLNFTRFRLEYSNVATPNDWRPIQPASSTPVLDGRFTTWVPPAYGRYRVRLAVEDAAGNLRERILDLAWDDRPSITDVYKEHEFVSPNGDQVQDNFVLHYRVVEPVHLMFEVLDKNNKVVRSIARDHLSVGVEAAFQWDGRDQGGMDLPDGQYRVRLQDYEFFTTLDRVAPVAELKFSSAYVRRNGGRPELDYVGVDPKLIWKSADANFGSMLQEMGVGETPDQWSAVPRNPRAGESSLVVEVNPPYVPLNLDKFANIQYRMTVQDKAGNKTVAYSGLAEEEVFATSWGYLSDRNGTGKTRWSFGSRIGYVALDDPDHREPMAVLKPYDGSGPISLHVFESVHKPLSAVALLVRAAGDCTTCWREVAISSFGVLKGDMVVASGVAPEGEFELVWDPKDLPRNKDYIFRVKLRDTAGTEFVSKVSYIFANEGAPRDISIEKVQDGRPGGVAVFINADSARALRRIDLLLTSLDGQDPRYLTPATVASRDFPPASYYHDLGQLQLMPCADYSFYLHAVFEGGGERDVVPPYPLQKRCLGVSWAVRPNAPESCNVQPSGMTTVTLKPLALNGRRLVQLLFGERLPNGAESFLNNWNDVKSEEEYTFEIDTAALPKGERQYFARLVDEDGKTHDEQITVNVAHDAPEMRITAPLAGGKLCPSRAKDGTLELPVEAEIGSSSPMNYGVEFGGAPWIQTLCTDADLEAETCRNARPVEAAHPKEDEKFYKKHGHRGYDAVSGEVGRVKIEPGQKSVTLRLHGYNGAGYNVCTAPIKVDYDAQVETEHFTIDRGLFSPLAPAPRSHVQIGLALGEELNVHIEVRAAVRGSKGELLAADNVVRTIVDRVLLMAGQSRFEWDGRDDGQQPVADGLYAIRVSYKDACQNELVEILPVEVDSTPPLLNIASPIANAKLGLLAAVTGTVRDDHLESYQLEFALASAPNAWLPLADGKKATPANMTTQLFANWNTFGLTEPMTLRLRAVDLAGNGSMLEVPVQIGQRGKLVTGFDATPSVFSPNGDGRQDFVSLRWTALDAVKATVTIAPELTPGKVIATLMKDADRDAGVAAVVWDGKSGDGTLQADGKYVAKLTLAAQDDAGNTQEETVGFVLDNSAPVLSLTNPLGDMISGHGSVTLDVADANLESYKVYFSPAPANDGSWQLAAEGSASGSGLSVKSLEGVAEGKYAIKAIATDQGGNRSELIKQITVDNTPPKPSLVAPANGAYLAARSGPVAVRGKIDEPNLASYSLRATRADNGDVIELAAANAAPAAELLANWDLANVADGTYVLALHAQDKAGLAGDASVTVVVDNTAPLAKLTAPASGAYVRSASDIVGVASDANLQEYHLEIAPGSKAAAQRWSPLGGGASSVEGGTLLAWQGLPIDGLHTLRLSVTDKAGNSAQAMAEVIVDTKPPAAPQGVRANVENGNDVRVSWTANTESDLAGYNVYRDGKRLNQALLKVTSYVDAKLAVGLYGYVVKAVDKAGWESDASARAPATVSNAGPTAVIYSPLAGAKVGASLEVKGTASAGNSFKEYRLYMGQGAAPADWKLLRRSPVAMVADILGGMSTLGIEENGTITLKLEAEDLSGQVATATAAVLVDNVAPLAPSQLAGQVNGPNASLSWTASPSADVAGYLLWRNGRLANAQGPVVGSLKPYLMTQTVFTDLKLANGDYTYTVQAMDMADNLSQESNPVQLNVRVPPHAVLAAPSNNARVGDGVRLRAVSQDSNLVQIEFQYRPAAGGAWIPVAPAATQAPFTVQWNTAGLEFGDYELQAVASGKFGLTDPAPMPILVHLGDHPAPVLAAKVNGNMVSLSWPSVPAEATGLVLVRHSADEKPGNEQTMELAADALAHTDWNVPAGAYRYTIHARYGDGSEGVASDDVPVLIYAPAFRQPYTPTGDSEFRLQASANGAGQMSVLRRVTGQPDSSLSFETAADGTMVPPALPLALGENRFELVHTDKQGNISMGAAFRVVRGTPPAKPSGLMLAYMQGSREVLQARWQANAEPDIIGYRAAANGATTITNFAWSSCDRSSMPAGAWPSCPLNGQSGGVWTPDPALGLADAWFVAQDSQQSSIETVVTHWLPGKAAADFDIEGWSGMEWVPLASLRGNTAETVETKLPQPYLTDRLRIKLMPTKQAIPTLSEVSAYASLLYRDTRLSFSSGDNPRIEVWAVNGLGLLSPAASTTAEGRDTPPAAVSLTGSVNGSQARLAWTASQAIDVAKYEIRMDGGAQGETAGLSYDATLKNGSYQFTVLAIDNDGNRSAASNVVTLVVNVPTPAAPANLSAQAERAGIALRWNRPTADVLAFRVLRSTQPGAAYASVADKVYGLSYIDNTAVPGNRYYYVVAGVDQLGNAGGNSNEAHAAMGAPDLLAAPVLFAPTISGIPFSTRQNAVDIVASASPGAQLSLLRGDQVVASATAQAQSSVVKLKLEPSLALADLSADGRMLAGTGPQAYLLDFAAQTIVPAPVLNSATSLRWSHDGRTIAFVDAAQSSLLQLYSPGAAAATPLGSLYGAQAGLAWSPDDSTVALAAPDRSGNLSLWLVNVADGTQRQLVSGAAGDSFAQLGWSPDGKFLSWSSGVGARIAAVTDGTVTELAANRQVSALNWTRDGAILLVSATDGDVHSVSGFAPASGQTTDIGVFGPGAGSLRTMPGNDGFVQVEDKAAVLRSNAGDYRALLAEDLDAAAPLLVSANGFVVYRNLNQEFVRLLPPGTARFANVALNAGVNRFAARSGAQGVPSAPVEITLADAFQPNLAVAEQGITFDKDVLEAGKAVRLSVAVSNAGAADAGAFSVALSAIDGNGAVSALGTRLVNALAVGQQQAVEADWTPASVGIYTIAAEIQAPGVAESRTDDNRAAKAVVVASPVPAPALTVDGVPGSSTLALSWTQVAPDVVTGYRVRRAASADGPFEQSGYAATNRYVDDSVKKGVRYCYTVTALDADGRDRATSNVASGMVNGDTAPAAPVLLAPASAGLPATVNSGRIDVLVSAEGGTTVALTRAGRVLEQARAADGYVELQRAVAELRSLRAVSANGRTLAYETTARDTVIVDQESGKQTRIARRGELSLSPDGKMLAYWERSADSDGYDLRTMVLDGETASTLATFPYTGELPAWSADSATLAVAGAQDGGKAGVWLFNIASGQRRLAAESAQRVLALAFSPDGQYLAFARDSGLQVIKTNDSSVVASAAEGNTGVSWSKDGKLLFTHTPANNIGEVREMSLPGGEVQTLLVAPGPYALGGAHWAGAAGHFVAEINSVPAFYSHGGVSVSELSGRASPARGMWYTRAGQVYLDAPGGGAFLRYDPPGLAIFKGVPLNEGDNAFGAYASDVAGRRGADALPAHVIYNPAPQPDLAAGANDIVVLPAAPVAGEATRVTITVRNAGNADAANVGAVLMLRDPQGLLTTLEERKLPSLAAGASASIAVDWKPSMAGVHTFALTLDAANIVAERNEFNNVGVLDVRVAESALPKVVVTTDAASYGGKAAVAGTIVLSNAGPALAAKLALRVEDAQGYLVAALPEQTVQLATGQELSLRTGWNTASYLAGGYRLVGELVDANGKAVQRGSADFRIAALRQVAATLAVDRGQYVHGQDVNLGGTVQLADANAQLDQVEAVLQVLAMDGSVLWSGTQPVGTLLPGASANVAALWNVGATAAGNYTARMLVRSGDSQLAIAETAFEVKAASATASVTGELALSGQAVANGDRLAARYTLNNAGATALAGVPVMVVVSRADNGAVLASVPAQADIAARGKAQGEAGFEVSGWPLTTLQVTLQASLDGKQVTLQRASLRVIDRVAPVLAWATPSPGSVIGGADAVVVAQATDRESQVASVEVAVDDSPWRAMQPRNLQQALYGWQLQDLADGQHSFRARATDSFGNVSPEAVLKLVVDNTAPVLSVSGIEEGGRYNAAVTPVASATDAHLANVTITLDNAAFASGTPVAAPGLHTLQVTARDQAGNSAVRSISFTLVSAAPELSGTLDASPARAEVGATVALSGTVRNGAVPAPGTRIELVIANSSTGALVFQSIDTVDLAAHASWNLGRGWTVPGPAGASYLATLSATAGGRSSQLAQASFTAVEPLPVLNVQQSAAGLDRVLVLSMCKRSASAGLGRCGAQPLTVDTATSLLLCDTNRAKTIDQFLDGLGVPHKTVVKETDFARELRSGAYSGYWISGGATKLRQPLTSELRNGLYLGESLVADGLHDLRQSDLALDGLLGMQYSGRFNGTARPKLSFHSPLLGSGSLSVLGDIFTLQGRSAATAEGLFQRDANQSVAWDDDACGTAAPVAGPEVQVCPAPGSTSGADAAVLSGKYGSGRTLLFGFDFEASCTAQGADPAWQAMARNSFGWLNQAPEQAGPMVAGDVLVRRTSLHNSGQRASVTVSAQLPAGAKLLESKPAGQVTAGANGDLVTWQLTLDGGADAQLDLRLQAPQASGNYQLHYSVSTAVGGSNTLLNSQDVSLQVADLDALGRAAADTLAVLPDGGAKSDAAGWLVRARASAVAGNYERALREAATAQARLEQLSDDAGTVQQALARLMRAIERRM